MNGERALDRLHAAARSAVSAMPTAAAFVFPADRVGLCPPLSALSLGCVMLGAALPAALVGGSEPLGEWRSRFLPRRFGRPCSIRGRSRIGLFLLSPAQRTRIERSLSPAQRMIEILVAWL
jgi:hypothetical protein